MARGLGDPIRTPRGQFGDIGDILGSRGRPQKPPEGAGAAGLAPVVALPLQLLLQQPQGPVRKQPWGGDTKLGGGPKIPQTQFPRFSPQNSHLTFRQAWGHLEERQQVGDVAGDAAGDAGVLKIKKGGVKGFRGSKNPKKTKMVGFDPKNGLTCTLMASGVPSGRAAR